jgi:hypothetical protein
MRYLVALSLALAVTGCMIPISALGRGGTHPAATARPVDRKEGPATLISQDGWSCVVPVGKYRNIRPGQMATCEWVRDGEARPLPLPTGH